MQLLTADTTGMFATQARPLDGRTAFITGSTSGIGLGVASALAARGANIVLNGFGDPASVEMTRQGMAAEHQVQVTYSPADLSDPAAIAEMLEFTRDVLGPVDNPGLIRRGRAEMRLG